MNKSTTTANKQLNKQQNNNAFKSGSNGPHDIHTHLFYIAAQFNNELQVVGLSCNALCEDCAQTRALIEFSEKILARSLKRLYRLGLETLFTSSVERISMKISRNFALQSHKRLLRMRRFVLFCSLRISMSARDPRRCLAVLLPPSPAVFVFRVAFLSIS